MLLCIYFTLYIVIYMCCVYIIGYLEYSLCPLCSIFIRFNGLAQWLGWLWPYAVLVIALVKLAIHSKQSSLST